MRQITSEVLILQISSLLRSINKHQKDIHLSASNMGVAYISDGIIKDVQCNLHSADQWRTEGG